MRSNASRLINQRVKAIGIYGIHKVHLWDCDQKQKNLG